jgi:nucleoside-diphosphate-sugar epimerase
MKIAVIGASGFLGNSIVDFLINKNFEVTALSREPIKTRCNWVKFNAEFEIDFDFFKNFTHIFYCAASGVQRNKESKFDNSLLVNALFPIKLSQFLQGTSVKLITFGSYFEIGNNEIDKEWNEEEVVFSQNNIENEYIKTKKLLSYWAFVSKSSYHFILPTIYGEKEDKNRLIPYLIDKFKNNLDVEVSSGEQIRQYIYINDLINSLWLIINNDIEKGVYNFPCTETFKVKEIITLISTHFKNTSRIIINNDFRDLKMKNLQLKGSNIFNTIEIFSTQM